MLIQIAIVVLAFGYPIFVGDLYRFLDLISMASMVSMFMIAVLVYKTKKDSEFKWMWFLGVAIIIIFLFLASIELNIGYAYEPPNSYDYPELND